MRTLILTFFISMLTVGCGKFAQPALDPEMVVVNAPTGTLDLSWDANREVEVNKAGGGYKVSYSESESFPVSSTTTVDVPWVSGVLAPTTVTLSGFETGQYYIKIVAYSALNTTGSTALVKFVRVIK